MTGEEFLQTFWFPWAHESDQINGEVARLIGPSVVEFYTDPIRHYHTLRHVMDCVEAAAKLELGPHPAAVLALVFHDAVYNPLSTRNEEQSAELGSVFTHMLTGSALTAAVVHHAILCTGHRSRAVSNLAQTVCDADLASLAKPWEEFDADCKAIRQEYKHVSTRNYIKGRKAILRRLVDRERIYQTETAYDLWETQAKANLRKHLDQLSGGGDDGDAG